MNGVISTGDIVVAVVGVGADDPFICILELVIVVAKMFPARDYGTSPWLILVSMLSWLGMARLVVIGLWGHMV